MKYSKLILKIFLIICCTFYTSYSQVGDIIGKVINSSENGISNAKVALISTLPDFNFKCEDSTNVNGEFKLSFDWSKINEANAKGAEWFLDITKDGYDSRKKTLFIASNEIDPNFFTLILKSNIYDKYSSAVDLCAQSNSSIYTLYLFDLISSDSHSNDIMHRLSFFLKNGINNYLESQKLLGNESIDVIRCSNVPVEVKESAVYFSKRLHAPGILWGFLQDDNNKILTDITITASFGEKELTAFTPLSYPKDSELFSPGQPIDKSYLALSCLLLGYQHYINKDNSLARKCFLKSKELNALPKEFGKVVNGFIQELDSTNAARDLIVVHQ